MEKKTVLIPNVSCTHCIMTIRNEVTEIEGVAKVKGDPVTKKITFEWKSPATWEDIEAALDDIGYPVKN